MSSSSHHTGNAAGVASLWGFLPSAAMTLLVGGLLLALVVYWCLDLDGERWLPVEVKTHLAAERAQEREDVHKREKLGNVANPQRVAGARTAAATTVAKSHIDINDVEHCDDCHEVQDATSVPPTIVQLRSFTACLVCHSAKEFAVTHGHTMEPLQDCELCHALHESTVAGKGLLSAPREVLCNACHDGDH